VALGGVGAWIGCRRRGIPLPAFGDAVAPGIVLAQAIGRIGNYFNQELYGRETTLPWGLEIFWREDAAGVRDPHLLDGVSTGELYKIVQPTFLYELLWNLVVFAVLIYADRRFRMGHGRLFALYVAGYCIGRFGIELLRDDAATHIAGIRVNSFTSTFVFIGAVVYILLATKGREDPDVIRRAWEQQGSGQQAVTEPEPEAEEELVAVGTANGVGSVVRVPKRLTGEGETDEDQDADEGADEADDVDDATAAEPDEDTETPEDAEDVEHVDDAAVVEDDDVAADDAAETDDVVQEADDATAADESDDATEAEDPEPEAEGSEEGEDPEALADPDEESEDAEPEPEVAADEGAETDTEPETSTDEDAEQR
jgi:hypothetical protein